MAKSKTWGEQQYETILRDAKARYGSGWSHLSEDQRSNYIDSCILRLLLGQAGDKYQPAQDLARQVYAAANT